MKKWGGIVVFVVVPILIFTSLLMGEEVIKFRAIEIRGQIQKPQVTYILPKSPLVRIGTQLKDLEPNFETQLWKNFSNEKKDNFK